MFAGHPSRAEQRLPSDSRSDLENVGFVKLCDYANFRILYRDLL